MDVPSGRVGPRNPRHKHDFDEMYSSTPPWDIGRPQPAFLALADTGALQGTVLDAGCGTGEHALMAAERGLEATGVDLAEAAIATAERKARERRLSAEFLVWDALDLPGLGRRFDTVLDCGLFHVFDDADRARFLISLREAVNPGARYFMLCFSDRQPGDWGPRRITEAELRDSFADGWRIDSLEPATIEITLDPAGARAWLVAMTRT
ncbi:MAG TPA: class I SAM-dependent methyltransferase [Acidimicrobiia bacterium]|nr:class I SAM-dependent methyltransferase [Acidimicrobiia bacterium]